MTPVSHRGPTRGPGLFEKAEPRMLFGRIWCFPSPRLWEPEKSEGVVLHYDSVSSSPGCPQTHCVAEDNLEL